LDYGIAQLLLDGLPASVELAGSRPAGQALKEGRKGGLAQRGSILPAEGYHLSNGVFPLKTSIFLEIFPLPEKEKVFFSSAVCDILHGCCANLVFLVCL
jgi:hypothetical protein